MYAVSFRRNPENVKIILLLKNENIRLKIVIQGSIQEILITKL